MSRSQNELSLGFTLIEMMVVLAMLAVLAMATAPVAQLVADRSRERELKAALREMRDAIDEYRRATEDGRISRGAGTSGYPPTLDSLVDGVPALSGGRIYFLRRIPRDPMANVPAEAEKWGLRSYASGPDHPMAGEDVFDVYSLAEGTGLDGTPYRKW
jgi:general secretion pathway protein G